MKDIKGLNKWRDSPCSWIEELYILKLSVISNLHRVNASQIKIPASHLADIKLNLNYIWRDERSRLNIEERDKVGGVMLLNFETYKKATAIKTGVLEKE
jgi:hypothetical protein